MTLVALIHATTASMAPAVDAFTSDLPSARLWNLLDDRLISEAEAAHGLTGPLRARMTALIEYAVAGGADAVQLSCSMYGPVTEDGTWPVPVLASDGALFDEVGRRRPATVALLGPTAAGVDDSVARLTRAAPHSAIRGRQVGRAQVLDAVRDETADLIVLGQFSLAPLHDEVQRATAVPVLSAPRLAVEHLRSLL